MIFCISCISYAFSLIFIVIFIEYMLSFCTFNIYNTLPFLAFLFYTFSWFILFYCSIYLFQKFAQSRHPLCSFPVWRIRWYHLAWCKISIKTVEAHANRYFRSWVVRTTRRGASLVTIRTFVLFWPNSEKIHLLRE